MKKRLAIVIFVAAPALACFVFYYARNGSSESSTTADLPPRSTLHMGGVTTIPGRRASPHFDGTNLPAPPFQQSPWTPPASDLRSSYLTATRVLFDAGMADPRGCEYREVEVGTGDVWDGDAGVVTTHAWVLPGKSRQSFAVCWNGLVYPVVSIGTNASLELDAANLITNGVSTWYMAIPEPMSVSHLTRLSIKGCLLLRLGRGDLADRYWAAGQSKEDPFLDWATEFVWAAFDRAICAHMRGDDGLAFASALSLNYASAILEDEAERRGFPRRAPYYAERRTGPIPYFDFLEPLPALFVDQRRRLQKTHRRLVIEAGSSKYPKQGPRIAALIEDLDQVAVRQMGQPGGLGGYLGNQTVAALVREGTAAIEPLLECLESEPANRLNRSVSFSRDFGRDRYVHRISESVIDALRGIMQTREFGLWATPNALAAAGTNKNKINAAQIRAYWRRFGSSPIEERWYQTLRDKNAGDTSWDDAIANIVAVDRSKTNTPRLLRGESLRSKTNPSVTELLANYATRQSNPMVDHVNYGRIDRFYLPKWIGAALSLAAWDPQASIPVLQARMATLLKDWEDSLRIPVDPNIGKEIDATVVVLSENILRVTLARMEVKDESTLGEYMNWLAQMPADRYSKWQRAFHKGDLFRPMWRYPKHQAVKAKAASIFNRSTSTLSPLLSLTNGERSIVLQEAKTLLCKIPEFQPLLLDALTNKSNLGLVAVRADGWITLRTASQNSGSQGGKPDLSKCDPNQSVNYRICDFVASQLARWKGMPKIELYWREQFRDEAVAALYKQLQEVILNQTELELIPTPPDPFADPYTEKD